MVAVEGSDEDPLGAVHPVTFRPGAVLPLRSGAPGGEHESSLPGVLPFIGPQEVAIAPIYLYPQIALWLPDAFGWWLVASWGGSLVARRVRCEPARPAPGRLLWVVRRGASV